MFLLNEVDKGLQMLNSAAETYLSQKKNEPPADQTERIPQTKDDGEPASVEEDQTMKSDDAVQEQEDGAANKMEPEQYDDDQWEDISSDEESEIKCSCPFKSLAGHLSNDKIAAEHLKKIESGCLNFAGRDLHSIITTYRSFFKSSMFIANAIHMEEAANQCSSFILF